MSPPEIPYAPPQHVLFICTENTARSIIAEAFLNHLGHGRFIAHSAGSAPSGSVHPLALAVLTDLGVSTKGLLSKSWERFADRQGPELRFVFTLCDKAMAEPCPRWAGQPITAHWSTPDPLLGAETPERLARRFRDCAIGLRRRIELLLAVPVHSLDTIRLADALAEISLLSHEQPV